ncbi:putative phage holin [Zhihengliuella halotolerans]|uniref:putative phage holin n=1 Tax=Zhihengliuella halotolerans TaxID=370736 RepID=UPI000C80808D|nr:hypothetical protein [Zhihengliuella halotolerans]
MSAAAGVLLAACALISVLNAVTWHAITRGAWRRYSAGRTVMFLVAAVGLLTGAASIHLLFPDLHTGPVVGTAAILLAALVYIGATIHRINSPRKGDPK